MVYFTVLKIINIKLTGLHLGLIVFERKISYSRKNPITLVLCLDKTSRSVGMH